MFNDDRTEPDRVADRYSYEELRARARLLCSIVRSVAVSRATRTSADSVQVSPASGSPHQEAWKAIEHSTWARRCQSPVSSA